MPDSVTEIGKEVFEDCFRLSDIHFSKNLTDIGVAAFRNCKNITNIQLPESLERFGVSAFNGCSLLQSIDIPTHVMVIPAYAFEGCQSLRKCSCKRKLKRIEERAFHWCVNLEYIEFEQQDEIYWQYPSELKLHKVSVLSGIEHYAFEGCTSLNHLVLPNSISFIGKCAFRYCYSLQDISFGSKLEAVNEEDEIILSVIDNPEEDIKKICNDWHIEQVLTDRFSELIFASQRYYKACEDYCYMSRGNCGEIFRIIETDNELIILDFYITD